MDRYYFIVNPVAGTGASLKAFARVRERMDAAGIDYGYAMSEYPGHAVKLTEEALAAGEKCIVSMGGDGTSREIAGVLAGKDAVFGVIPCGTGNDFVRATHIPQDTDKALDILLNNAPCPVDAGTANGGFFLNVAGFGFDTDVVKYTEKFKKKLNGNLPYMLGILQTMLHLTPRKMTVSYEGGEFTRKALLICAANGTHFGGGMHVCPNSLPDDGLFDVCILHDINILTFLYLLPRFKKGKHVDPKYGKYFTFFRTAKMRVTTELDCEVQLDGELVGNTPAEFIVLKGALNMITGDPVSHA